MMSPMCYQGGIIESNGCPGDDGAVGRYLCGEEMNELPHLTNELAGDVGQRAQHLQRPWGGPNVVFLRD